MSTVALFSAKGAPGVTTTAMLMASLWPRPALLADCDPAGGDIGLRLPAPDGHPLDLSRGMLSLLPVARRALDPEALLTHAQAVLGGGEVIVGLSGPEQAAAVGPVWTTLATAFGTLPGRDVIVDVGRLDPGSPVLPLVGSAALAVCVLGSSLAGVYAARARLRTVLPALAGGDGGGPRVALVVQAGYRRDADGAASVLAGEFPQLVYLGHLATDRDGARIFDGEPVSRPERTLLVRSGTEIVSATSGMLYAMSAWRSSSTAHGETPDAPQQPPERAAAGSRRRGRRRREDAKS